MSQKPPTKYVPRADHQYSMDKKHTTYATARSKKNEKKNRNKAPNLSEFLGDMTSHIGKVVDTTQGRTLKIDAMPGSAGRHIEGIYSCRLRNGTVGFRQIKTGMCVIFSILDGVTRTGEIISIIHDVAINMADIATNFNINQQQLGRFFNVTEHSRNAVVYAVPLNVASNNENDDDANNENDGNFFVRDSFMKYMSQMGNDDSDDEFFVRNNRTNESDDSEASSGAGGGAVGNEPVSEEEQPQIAAARKATEPPSYDEIDDI